MLNAINIIRIVPLASQAKHIEEGESIIDKPAPYLTEQDLSDFYERLTTEQQTNLRSLIEELYPVQETPQEYLEQHWLDDLEENSFMPKAIQASCDPGAAPYCWKQGILDYIFIYSRDASDPNRLRWWSASGWVQLILEVYQSTPTGYGFNLWEVRLCLGDGVVDMLGIGTDAIFRNLYIMYP